MSPFRSVRSICPRLLLLSALTAISLTAGCISTRELATLSDGEVLYVSEETNLFGSKPIRVGVIKTDGHRIEVRSRSAGSTARDFSSYEVRQSDDQATVWYVDNVKKVPLGAIHVNEQGERWTLPFVPKRKQEFGSSQLACSVHRTLIENSLDKQSRVRLTMNSKRDLGNRTGDQDFLYIDFCNRKSKSFFSTQITSKSQLLLTLKGDDCLHDPLTKSHPWELREDASGRGVCVVNRDTSKILGGFDRETEALFKGDELPDWLTNQTADETNASQATVVMGK